MSQTSLTSQLDTPLPVDSVGTPLSMREVAILLLKHYGLHEGKYELTVEFAIGTGTIGPDPVNVMPGAMVAIRKMGLVKSTVDGITTVDAAILNPRPKANKVARERKLAVRK